jgi:hypothetical protein
VLASGTPVSQLLSTNQLPREVFVQVLPKPAPAHARKSTAGIAAREAFLAMVSKVSTNRTRIESEAFGRERVIISN